MAGRALQRKLEQAKRLKPPRKMATMPSSPVSSGGAGPHLTIPVPKSPPSVEKAEVEMVEMNESFRQLQAWRE